MICATIPGQPMTSGRDRKRDELKPSPSFHRDSKSKNKKQYDQLMADAEMLRVIGVQVSHGKIEDAHRTLDELAKKSRGTVRYMDIHVQDIGVPGYNVPELAKLHIHTIGDLANQNAAKFVAQFNVVDCLDFVLLALRKIRDLEQAR